MTQRTLSAMLLAAGEGTRMRSNRPKPLHLLCGRAMLLYVLDSLRDVSPKRAIVVVGHGAERVTKKLQEDDQDLVLDFVEQHVQRGTGDAASVGLTALTDDELDEADSDILVLPGDTPLLRTGTVAALLDRHRSTDAACTVLTARVPDPTGYGRVVRDKDDRVARIVEQADASEEDLAIDEINTSIYCFRLSVLAPALRRLSPENAQGEYYLTDVVEVLHDAGYPVFSLIADDFREMQGVNDRVQLSEAEAELRRRTNESWQRRGVTMIDPGRTYIDATVKLGTDVTLFPGTLLQGHCVIGDGAEVGPGTRLVDCVVGAGATVEQTTGCYAEIGDRARVGPYAVLEAGTSVAAGVTTGPFYTALSSDEAGA